MSHLYLSPIFAATEGSTHGYDITDPTRIETAWGGKGFAALAEQAKARDLGIILDTCRTTPRFPCRIRGWPTC